MIGTYKLCWGVSTLIWQQWLYYFSLFRSSEVVIFCAWCCRKFICLNDNLNSSREEDNQLIRAVLIDFFHSLFPKPSQFELPVDYRNRYLYYEDFVVWQSNRKKLSFITYTILIVTIVFIFYCLFNVEVSFILCIQNCNPY